MIRKPGQRIAATLVACIVFVGCMPVYALTAFAADRSAEWQIHTENAPWSGFYGFVDEDRSRGINGYFSRHWMHGWNANGEYGRSMGKWMAPGEDSRAPRLSYDYTIGGYFGDFNLDM
ncbi:hypothetical protein G1C96_0890 [Bifidobacterium sp. DSM 109958]|uniref:Uncharacterized protein n=1 Tax=Bifidobacterium moraviense TaxID=2675323 RepID=A0A7Y0F1H8_9BIFI|nr:hypothetical protein [Bifidobacterium sp. DSM 109958]NMN00312.1 hypothetical protein [Bifidobacterium sp. DSM 109958]